MSMIETARGAVPLDELGRVLIHEHIFLMDMEYTCNYRPDFFTGKTIDDAVARLDALKASGVDTIIDLTVLGLGRHMPSLARAAAKTGLNIIVSTGAYTFDAVPSPFQFWGPGLLKDAKTEPMVDHFLADITQGIAGTGVRAGMLKCAIDEPGLTPGVERVMRAVARTHTLTGTPITVHTAPRQETGLVVQQILEEEGADLEHVVIGHCGDTTDIDYLMRLADRGSLLGMDRFGVDFALSTQERIATIAQLVRRGYAGQLTLSHDCCCWSDYFPDIADYHAAMPHHHYLHIHNDVVPALLEAGVSQADIDRMFTDNPRRLFNTASKAVS
ncbi:phosphotriesterase family protein [Novosphingobium beihaiensis]|uniref:Phosphotriesterase-related protein n=1 Tax=Novosphingobium beihaiensis TaxID=2930389 RepID=A0ABT0BL20_9SPHN|nr:phosphotriesterase-related protein [Novosphingobium beihaiensis]MCJ2185737.1 phosphotriesterase-related protein [Novosphingobium beihaiensis]